MNKIFIYLFLFSAVAFSQNGPGGVGSTTDGSFLMLWVYADNNSFTDGSGSTLATGGSAVMRVNDFSANADYLRQPTANEIPIYLENTVNGYGTLKFNSLNGPHAMYSILDAISNNPTVFIIFNFIRSTFTNAGILHAGPTAFSTTNNDKVLLAWISTSTDKLSGRVVQSDGTMKDFSPSDGYLITKETTYLLRFSLASGTAKQVINEDNSTGAVKTVSYDNTLKNWTYFGLGKQGTQGITGYIPESIVYKTPLNSAQNVMVTNYLSAKYNTSLLSNDFYVQDNSANGDFDHKVAGIGRIDASNIHNNSRGTGIIRISNPTNLDNNEFLFWGENIKSATYAFTTNASSYREEINTKWRVSETGDAGSVTITVNASDINLTGKLSCAALQLIVDNNSDFSSPTTIYNFTESAGVYTATGVNFSNSYYFTLSYHDKVVIDATTAYNGSGTSNLPNTNDNCYKLLVKGTADGTPSLTQNANVKEVEVESGGKLVVDTGLRLLVTNGITNNGEIRLLGNSQLLQTNNVANSGTGNLYMSQTGTTVNVYQSGYWSSPVNTGSGTYTISGVLKDGTTALGVSNTPPNINFVSGHDGSKSSPISISKRWLAKFVNATSWTAVNETSTLNIGEGWNMKSTGGGTQNFIFIGKPNNGDYSHSLGQNNYSLLGNPYPSALDADAFITANSSNFTGTLYFWQSKSSTPSHYKNDYQGGYATRVLGMGTGFDGGTAPAQYTPVGQGFFVNKTSSGTGTLNFTNSQRSFVTRGATSVFFSKTKKDSSFPILRVHFSYTTDNTDSFTRELAVGLRGKTNAFEPGYDAEMFDQRHDASDFGLQIANNPYPFVISGIQDFDTNLKIPLVFFIKNNNSFLLSVKEFPLGQDVYLWDTLKNTKTKITPEGVQLNLPDGEYKDRFYFVFAKTLSLEDNKELEQLKVWYQKDQKHLRIDNPDNVKVQLAILYDIFGKEIRKWNSFPDNLDVEGAPKGIYILKVNTKSNLTKIKKVAIY